jgi:hypothetical protein
MGECAAVCLETQRHNSGVSLTVDGDYTGNFSLTWDQLTEQHFRTCADIQEATEYGACGVAVLVIRETTGKTILERSAKGTGFDFWVGEEEDAELPFQGMTRLEISGILSGDISRVKSRTGIKKAQVTPSDGQFPALIAVVEFGHPLARLENK